MALVTAPVEVCVSLGLMTVVVGPTPTEIPDSILESALAAGATEVQAKKSPSKTQATPTDTE
jgi:hypothetical protein